MSGLFLNFEGLDGSGKTTQLQLLAERLRGAGREVVATAEPGGTRIGQQIRRILLDPEHTELSPTTELLLYFAARSQNVDELVRPALARDAVVLTDRWTDSSLAYQGAARGLGMDLVRQLDRIACRGTGPDLTLCIDIDLETSRSRAKVRSGQDRMEANAVEFHTRVHAAYQQLATDEPDRFVLVDGSGTVEQVAERVWTQVRPLLSLPW